MAGLAIAAVLVVVLIFQSCTFLREHERGVVLRAGRILPPPRGPGLVYVLWPLDRLVRFDMRSAAEELPAQEVTTLGDVPVRISGMLHYRIVDPLLAFSQVVDHRRATVQLAQSTLRIKLGELTKDVPMDELSTALKTSIDEQARTWGVQVSDLELTVAKA